MHRTRHLGPGALLVPLLLALFFALIVLGAQAKASPTNVISQDVAVCDPYNPNACQRPGAASTTDASGTVTTGNTFQTALAANSKRQSCLLQNPTTATEPLYVFFGTLGSATTAKSFTLSPGSAINCTGPGGMTNNLAVNVTAATTGHAFTLIFS